MAPSLKSTADASTPVAHGVGPARNSTTPAASAAKAGLSARKKAARVRKKTSHSSQSSEGEDKNAYCYKCGNKGHKASDKNCPRPSRSKASSTPALSRDQMLAQLRSRRAPMQPGIPEAATKMSTPLPTKRKSSPEQDVAIKADDIKHIKKAKVGDNTRFWKYESETSSTESEKTTQDPDEVNENEETQSPAEAKSEDSEDERPAGDSLMVVDEAGKPEEMPVIAAARSPNLRAKVKPVGFKNSKPPKNRLPLRLCGESVREKSKDGQMHTAVQILIESDNSSDEVGSSSSSNGASDGSSSTGDAHPVPKKDQEEAGASYSPDGVLDGSFSASDGHPVPKENQEEVGVSSPSNGVSDGSFSAGSENPVPKEDQEEEDQQNAKQHDLPEDTNPVEPIQQAEEHHSEEIIDEETLEAGMILQSMSRGGPTTSKRNPSPSDTIPIKPGSTSRLPIPGGPWTNPSPLVRDAFFKREFEKGRKSEKAAHRNLPKITFPDYTPEYLENAARPENDRFSHENLTKHTFNYVGNSNAVVGAGSDLTGTGPVTYGRNLAGWRHSRSTGNGLGNHGL